MIVNSFILCGTAESTETGTWNITDAGIRTVYAPVAADWKPGDPIGVGVSAVLFAQYSTGDAETPTLDVLIRSNSANPDDGYRVSAMLSGWCDGPVGTKYIHETFALQFLAETGEGTYLLTVHPEGFGLDKSAAFLPLDVVAVRE